MDSTAVLPRDGTGTSDARLTARRLSVTALSSTAVRLLGPVCAFMLSLLLARSLGAAGSGVFYVTLTLVTAFAIVAKFGLETALQRFVGAELGRDRHTAVVAIYQQARGISLALSLLASALTVAAAELIAEVFLGDPAQAASVRLLGLLIVPFTQLGIHAAMLKALGRPIWGGFFEAGAWPTLTLLLVTQGFAVDLYSTEATAAAYLLAATFVALAAWAMVRGQLPHVIQPLAMASRPLLRSCLSLTGVELMNFALLWTPFVLLPMLADAAEAGQYNVAHRLAAQLGLLMLVVASITSARFAAHHEQRNHTDLRRLAGQATRTLIMLGLPPAVVLLMYGEAILALFGDEFLTGATALQILVIGQLVNLATGPVGYLLAMTGHERALRNVLLATMMLMAPLAMVLIPVFGASGAAAAVAFAMTLHNVICNHLVARYLDLPHLLLFAR
jgi:O-antigen/teichoic acid export membrane protein